MASHGDVAQPAISVTAQQPAYAFPAGVAIDASGKLYVANWGYDTVSVFDTAHGNAELPVIFTGAVDRPSGMAIDAAGKLYVAGKYRVVGVFDTAHGNRVLPVIAAGGVAEFHGAAVDANGRLYVLTSTRSLSV